MKIEQIQLFRDDVIQGTSFNNKNTSRLRVKFLNDKTLWGLFLNDTPYLVHPTLDENYQWEINTNNNCWINSIKFDYNTENGMGENDFILIEVYYED